jgi:pyruvyl transferase EpsI
MTETSISYAVAEEKREAELRKKWKEFLSARVVITDRLHGMVFAAITGTPCIVLTNYNHKLSGSYQWLESLHYIKYCNRVEFLQEILESVKREMFGTDLGVMPDILLKAHYEKLAGAIYEERKHV